MRGFDWLYFLIGISLGPMIWMGRQAEAQAEMLKAQRQRTLH